ncbi:hypothetical protein SIAM614_27847 [Stappia aggregata IAM 12614]|uniref:Uncharacterized protein n=2 Tax=Roseibium aggregatum TaxID=187304 RepID=A0NXC8_ROSAI|nr:hypothetical protein SIAM614_27847 [Stappia aggregata IAM 12614] [Roseibium aggregatum IAM 12614]
MIDEQNAIGSMRLTAANTAGAKLDMELCRALYEKDPDRLLKLVSDWLETNGLQPSEDFEVPDYLNAVLTRGTVSVPGGSKLRVLVS